ncbi:MAG: hypothetical protein KTR17_10195 [Cellvibrionaceae bacterium]|nr:hypothetical protein [Cellvibrionaceae bacterium]
MKVDSIMITGIYLLIWTAIVSIVWPIKLVVAGVQLSQWEGEFQLLFEILFLGWTTSLSLAILFRMIRYSSTGRLVGSIAFGVATPLVYFIFITSSGLIFEGRIVTYVAQIVTQRDMAIVYSVFFLIGTALYQIIYGHT